MWHDVGERLWPFVRYFGLCGADPRAIDAVAALAVLLGHDSPAGAIEREQVAKLREKHLDEFCGVLPDALRGRILSRQIEPFVDSIRQRLASAPIMSGDQNGGEREGVAAANS